MSTLCLVQSSFNPLTRKLVFFGIVGVVNKYIITIDCARLAGVRFFLFDISYPISFTHCLQFRTQTVKRYLDKVLVIASTNIDFAQMVGRLITQMFTFLKKILPHSIKPYFVEILAKSAQFTQSHKFRLIQFSDLVLLGQVHQFSFATLSIVKRKLNLYSTATQQAIDAAVSLFLPGLKLLGIHTLP